jgi:hypothetical protein
MIHKLTILVGVGMVLGSILLWQRSMMVHVAYRQSALAQEKKKLLKEIHRLEVDIRQFTRPQVLYDYWQRNQSDFNFRISQKEKQPSIEEGKSLVRYAGFRPQGD